jgi:hypothetical protein
VRRSPDLGRSRKRAYSFPQSSPTERSDGRYFRYRRSGGKVPDGHDLDRSGASAGARSGGHLSERDGRNPLGCSGQTARYHQIPMEAYKRRVVSRGMSEAFAQGLADMMPAKNEGMDNTASRAVAADTPTTFISRARRFRSPPLAHRLRSADLLCRTPRALRMHLVRNPGRAADSRTEPAIEAESATSALSSRSHDRGACDRDKPGYYRTVCRRMKGLVSGTNASANHRPTESDCRNEYGYDPPSRRA